MPHRIRLRNWTGEPVDASVTDGQAAADGVTAVRHFNRPSNLSGCTIQLVLDAAAPNHASLNEQALERCDAASSSRLGAPTPESLPADATEATRPRWKIPVDALLPRSCFRLTWLRSDTGRIALAVAPENIQAWLEIHDETEA